LDKDIPGHGDAAGDGRIYRILLNEMLKWKIRQKAAAHLAMVPSGGQVMYGLGPAPYNSVKHNTGDCVI
jgi:hypothetical protein